MTSILIIVIMPTTPLAAIDAARPRCFRRPATISAIPGNGVTRGTPGDDVIVGTNGKDTIYGRGGNDRICSRGGTDWVKGQAGHDQVRGSRGKDFAQGGRGKDQLYGGRASDTFSPGRDDDSINGGRGKWDLVNYAGVNRGGMVIDLHLGRATGLGRDDLARIKGATAGYGTDRIIGDAHANVLYVHNYDDALETVRAGAGRDFIHVYQGTTNFTARGGEGRDTIGFSFAEPVRVDLRLDRVSFEGYGDDPEATITSFSNVQGSHRDDVIRGDDRKNLLEGYGGNDRILGRGGGDFLNGWGTGRPTYGRSDHLDGGPGNDICVHGTRYQSCESRQQR